MTTTLDHRLDKRLEKKLAEGARTGPPRQETSTPTAAQAEQNRALKVLAVEDNLADYELILNELQRGGFEVSAELVQTAEEFRARLLSNRPDIVLADHHVGSWQGMEAVKMVRDEGLDIPAILVSGALGDVTAVECIKQGATDYVLKDSLGRLSSAIRRALQEKELAEERRRTETDLTQKIAELARSNQDLEQFAYAASHDLQEPLRMVTTYVQLLEERYKGKLDASADKYIHYAVDGAARMRTLIQDLLAFSRSGEPRMKTGSTNVHALMERVLENLTVSIQESGAAITTSPLPTVSANTVQLEQVFQNLIGNAIKFRSTQSPAIHISAEATPEEWTFSVQDNGIGIAQEHAEMVFSVFKRLHTREEYPGNGIGLSICKKIIERHGGKIWLESSPGKGSCFGFTLPNRKDLPEERA